MRALTPLECGNLPPNQRRAAQWLTSLDENHPPTLFTNLLGKLAFGLTGKDHYLGPYNTPESHDKYTRLLAEWTAVTLNSRELEQSPVLDRLTIAELLVRYLEFAKGYYVNDRWHAQQGTWLHERCHATTQAAEWSSFGPDVRLTRCETRLQTFSLLESTYGD